MSLQGDLEFRDANKITFIGGSSNTLIDLTTGSLGVGVTGTSLSSNLHVAGNKIKVGDNIFSTDGPHGRGVALLKKYPEIAFADGKFDSNGLTLLPVQTQAGYTVSASKASTDFGQQWTVFDGLKGAAGSGYIWRPYSYNGGNTQIYDTNGNYDPTTITAAGEPVSRLDTNTEQGEWISVEMPKAIKLKHFHLYTQWNSVGNIVDSGHLYAKNTSTDSWVKIHSFSDATTTSVELPTIHNVNSTTSYKQFALIVTKSAGAPTIGEWELYGYEEDPPLGDTSVDTTFTSIMNTPQTTGANVYVDAKLSSDFTNQVTGPTPVGTSTTHDNTNKYWELTGELTSNISVEANTFLEGDQPHAVSVWFNSSNLEANVSNTCVFSISDQEKLDSVNLDLQSNTWHNLTYSYQGEGGSRVAYLDGRKVAEDQAEDTFGDYPPFAMTGFSQGGYVASVSNYQSGYEAWEIFDQHEGASGGQGWWQISSEMYSTSGNYDYISGSTHNLGTSTGSSTSTDNGHWVKIEMPHKLKLSYVNMKSQQYHEQGPKDFKFYGSKNNKDWELIKSFINATPLAGRDYTINSTVGYKAIGLVVTAINGHTGGQLGLSDMQLYGHRENDLVRLPDPTNVLKYPHIAMTGPAQRGYVVSASDFHGSYPPWQAFDDKYTDISSISSPVSPHATSRWQPTGGYATTGSPRDADGTETTTLASGSSPSTYDGEWIQLESLNKVNIKSYRLYNSTDYVVDYNAHTVVLLGSNTGIDDWVDIGSGEEVLSWSPNTSTANGSHVSTLASVSTSGNTGFYKYHRLVVRKCVSQNLPVIYQLQLYGTEEDISIPLQIGGGNIDKVANFRVYDTFVGEDQALEIWDAQKDEFRGVKNSVTLQKGRLGLGTTEPEGRLAVLDEPHNLEEFPPRAMSGGKNFGGGGGETYFNGYGKFRATAANSLSGTTYGAIKAFNKANLVNADRWRSNNDFTNGIANTSYVLADGVTPGVWIKLEMPINIKLARYEFVGQEGQGPADAEIWASNDDKNWTKIHSFSGNTIGDNTTAVSYPVNSENFYKIYAMVVLKTISLTVDATSIKELKFFGTREQGQSVLHDGQLTLTKSLNVPRIGPALDADDTPRRDRLVVEYNTSTNPTFEGAVRDTSGRGNDGVFYGTAAYNAGIKAFVFDGNSDYIQGNLANSGDIDFTVSCWLKRDTTSGNVEVFYLGSEEQNSGNTVGYGIGLQIQSGSSGIVYFFIKGGAEIQWNGGGSNFGAGVWNHLVCTRRGIDLEIYLNGVLEQNVLDPANGTDPLQLLPNSNFQIARRPGTPHYLDGQISNFKLYDTVLTPEEVKTLYDMGRCDEGHHVVNFSKTRVGIGLGDGEAPTYTLDVRGQIRSQGSLVTSFTGQHKCIPEEPMEKGLIVSAKKNQFVKLNGLATGKSAITIDESLPIVSLSNVVQDKACFGVVSSTEEANTTFRVETTNGGVISTIPKTLGDNRAIVNSVGEGAIWVVDTGGSLESGDYITTSNVAGYGQRQESEFLANYTVAKITMDCDFTASNVAVQTIKREQTGTRTITEDAWNQLVEYDRYSNVEDEITTYYQIQRGENVLDENGQLQFEDKTGATESPYERRFLTTDGTQTDEANAVHIAAFVGCTYHCG